MFRLNVRICYWLLPGRVDRSGSFRQCLTGNTLQNMNSFRTVRENSTFCLQMCGFPQICWRFAALILTR